MNITVIGISHRTAPVEAREALALPGDLAERLLRALHADDAFAESLVLDTCNRTEVYVVPAGGGDPRERLLGHIAELKSVAALTDTSALYTHQGQTAAEHLFRVAAGLDSQIVGEHQILGQVRSAYRLACEAGASGFFLNKLLHWTFRVGKRVQTETDLGQGSTGVAQAAVELAGQVFSSLAGKSVMLVGAGETGALAAKALVRCGVGRIIVANRSLDRARQVAGGLGELRPEDIAALDLDDATFRCPALRQMSADLAELSGQGPSGQSLETQVIELDQIPAAIGEVDLVISATGAPDLVLTGPALTEAVAKNGRPLFIVDIAVPRDVDPELARLSNVFLYNIDDLDRVVANNVAARRLEIPRAETIVADELATFTAWFDSLQVTPTIQLLQQHIGQLRQAELKRYGGQFNHADRDQLDQFTRSLLNKVLHQPIAFLRELSDETPFGDRLAAVEMIRKLFDLDRLEGGQ